MRNVITFTNEKANKKPAAIDKLGISFAFEDFNKNKKTVPKK